MNEKGTYRCLLNLLCQKNTIEYPTFKVHKVDGKPHKPVFQAYITFNSKKYISNKFGTKAECEEDLARQIYMDPEQQLYFRKISTESLLEDGLIKVDHNIFNHLMDVINYIKEEAEKLNNRSRRLNNSDNNNNSTTTGINIEKTIETSITTTTTTTHNLKLMMIDIENVSDLIWTNINKYIDDDYLILVVQSKSCNNTITKKLPQHIKLLLYLADSICKDAADIAIIMILSATFHFIHEYVILTKDHFAITLQDIVSKEGIKLNVIQHLQI